MGKRSRERSEEEIRRKIRKLQIRLSRGAILEPSQDDSNDSPQEQQSGHLRSPQERDEVLTVDLDYEYTDYDSPQQPTGESSPPNMSRHTMALPSLPPTPEAALTALSPPVAGTSTAGAEPQNTELELEDDILELLGDAPKTETPLGPPIHKDVASRWQEILAKGLPKDVKDSLFKAYNFPSNCDLLTAPTLNPEVKAALPELLIKRDTSLFYKQKQLGSALVALASAMDLIVSNESSKQKILKPIESHSSETKTRRNFVISTINTKLKDTLLETNQNSMLFRDNVTEKVKAAKTIQQSGDALKTQQKPKTLAVRPNNNANRKKGNLNFVGQHRKVDNVDKPQSGMKRLTWAAHCTTANTSSSLRQRRSSPPRTSPQRAPAHPLR